jgi:HEAT repeat protein/cyclophilin family peptidyl-prolyl cis-trans isomerase
LSGRARTMPALWILAGLTASGCASAPSAVKGPTTTFDQKMAWMLQLEDQRILRVESPPAVAVVPARRGRALPAAPAPTLPDLATLVVDAEPRVRRRAAMAIGRVGLADGVKPLTTALGDADPEVREMAAFGLGLIADPSAAPALTAALADASPVVRGRAAEALGLLGSTQAGESAGRAAAAAIGRMVGEYARSAAVRGMQPDDETWPAAPEVEAFRLGLYALVRLHAYDPLAAAVIDNGAPVTLWWPVAYALGRIEDARAAPALLKLLTSAGKYSAAFAARGLGTIKDRAAVAPLAAVLKDGKTPLEVRVSAIRALAAIGDAAAGGPLSALASEPAVDPNVRLELVTALGVLKATEGLPVVQDLLSDPWPTMRAAALRAAASIDPESFVVVLSSMDPDPQWTVRAALASVLATMPPELAMERVRSMLRDEDKRAIPSVLRALARLKAPDAATVAIEQLKEPDFAVRAAAAEVIGELKPPAGPDALRAAYTLALGDAAMDARASILSALVSYGPAEATPALKAALGDKEWALRLRAAEALAKFDPAGDFRSAIRPAPGAPIVRYDDPQLIAPALSPHVFLETARGTIEVELAVLDAPQTTSNFMALAARGFFNGLQIHRVVPNFVVQDGDPRGDGEGGPGYSIRDELNERPFLRGTVGMALSGKDTGGSQFFIVHSPQPHLDAKYTVFGRVVNGMDVVDRIQAGDVIQRVRVWDGKTMR